MNKIEKLFKRYVLYRLPSKLPFGVSEFEAWTQSIIDVYDLPDNDSVRFALATMICHAGTRKDKAPKTHISKHYFGATALKGGSNQVALSMMESYKLKQKEQEALAALSDPNKHRLNPA